MKIVVYHDGKTDFILPSSSDIGAAKVKTKQCWN